MYSNRYDSRKGCRMNNDNGVFKDNNQKELHVRDADKHFKLPDISVKKCSICIVALSLFISALMVMYDNRIKSKQIIISEINKTTIIINRINNEIEKVNVKINNIINEINRINAENDIEIEMVDNKINNEINTINIEINSIVNEIERVNSEINSINNENYIKIDNVNDKIKKFNNENEVKNNIIVNEIKDDKH